MLLDITRSFIDRRCQGADSIQIERIAKAYQKWKITQLQSGPQYQVSREWLPIYSKYMDNISYALINGDIPRLKGMYENFFRDPLSTGLHGMHFDMVEKYMNPEIGPSEVDLQAYMKVSIEYANNFLLNCKDLEVKVLERSPVGNPYGYSLDNIDVFPCAEYHFYFARKIGTLLREAQSPVVMELGGGFGGMAYYLLRDFPRVKFIGVDLPENAALQAYYLMSYFPDLKIRLFGEENFTDVQDFDVLILPNYAIETLSENSIDLSYNSYSLAEMSLDSANNYMKLICHMTKSFILHLNHVYWEVSADNFPIDYTKFQLLFRNPTMWGKDPGRYYLDHHEFLYVAK